MFKYYLETNKFYRGSLQDISGIIVIQILNAINPESNYFYIEEKDREYVRKYVCYTKNQLNKEEKEKLKKYFNICGLDEKILKNTTQTKLI